MRKYKTACSLDCWDTCSIEVNLTEDNKMKITGDPHHSITQGFLCQKGMQHLDRVNSPQRITAPRKKIDNQWVEIGWDQAIREISLQLREIINSFGASSLLLYSESGHCGLKKNIDTAFFNSLGKVTLPTGSLCWGAGIAAQKADFGNALSHPPDDLLRAQSIIIWGRNPVNTNIHLVPFLKKAKTNGVNIILIDPVKTATANLATHYYQISPESDGHLALAMAKIIINENLHGKDFLYNNCEGFSDFLIKLGDLDLDKLIEATGLTKEAVLELTHLYAQSPSAIVLGYGLQRYPHGGRNIRLIDALAAIAGNIGIAGGGVSYANQFISQWIDWQFIKNSCHEHQPSFIRSQFHQYILEERPNEIKGMFVTKGNPLLQLPNTSKNLEAFSKIPFKVTIDLFMTDTAAASNYVLPCTHIFEEEDFLFSSMWHSHFFYTEQILPPRGDVRKEFDIFKSLAKELNMHEYLQTYGDEKAYMEKGLQPLLSDIGLSLKELQGKNLSMMGNEVPWKSKIFDTSTKKFQFVNLTEISLVQEKHDRNQEFPLQLLSLHPKHSLHSQHFNEVEEGVLPKVFSNQSTMNRVGISLGEVVELESEQGKITVVMELDEGVGKDLLLIYEGWWLKNQGVNLLTPHGISDIGNQAIYNYCFCKINRKK